MKYLNTLLIAGILAVAAGCSYTGANPKPPTKVEQSIFDSSPSTNYAIEITEWRATNADGIVAISLSTNLVPVIGHKLTTSESTKATVSTITTLVNTWLPGVGTLAGTALAGMLAAWARMRSQKNAAPVLAQNIETLLEFITTLPDGEKYRKLLTDYMLKHQLEAGSANTILTLIQKYVSNPEAKGAVIELQAALAALK